MLQGRYCRHAIPCGCAGDAEPTPWGKAATALHAQAAVSQADYERVYPVFSIKCPNGDIIPLTGEQFDTLMRLHGPVVQDPSGYYRRIQSEYVFSNLPEHV